MDIITLIDELVISLSTAWSGMEVISFGILTSSRGTQNTSKKKQKIIN